MALTAGNTVTATDINNLKASVKAEMLRRKYYGSVASYGSASYDYSTRPASGVSLLVEH